MRSAIRCIGAATLSVVLGAPVEAGPIQTLLGLPDWVDFSIQFTSEPMGGIQGGLNPSASSWFQNTVVGLSVGSGLNKPEKTWKPLDHWQVNLELTNQAGNPNLNTELGSEFTLQTLVNPVGTWITAASVERNRGQSWWSASAGLLSMDPDFLVTPAMNSYINSTLNNTLNLLVVGLPINPFVTPGVKVAAHSETMGSLTYGYFYLDPETSIASSLGVNPEQPQVRGGVQALQWSTNPLRSRQDLLEPIRVNNSPITVERLLPAPEAQLGSYLASTQLPSTETAGVGSGLNRGIYGSLTWPLKLPLGMDNRLWAAGSLSLDPENNPFPTFLGGGWLSQGVLPNRPLDVLALGFSRTSFSPTLSPGATFEGVIELNYSIHLSETVQLQPVMQWVINPGGQGQIQGIWAGGVQLNLNL